MLRRASRKGCYANISFTKMGISLKIRSDTSPWRPGWKRTVFISPIIRGEIFEEIAPSIAGPSGLLSPDTDAFLQVAKEAPVRTAVMAKQLADTIKQTPKGMSSEFKQAYLNRIQFVHDNVLPEARNQMSEQLSSSDPASGKRQRSCSDISATSPMPSC